MGLWDADFPSVITRENDLNPLRISDLGSVNLKGLDYHLRRLPFVAHGEFVATFCPAAIKYFSAVLCRHACAKAVRVLTFADVRLKCSLHASRIPSLETSVYRKLMVQILHPRNKKSYRLLSCVENRRKCRRRASSFNPVGPEGPTNFRASLMTVFPRVQDPHAIFGDPCRFSFPQTQPAYL